MVAATILTSTTTSTLILARVGPRALIVARMAVTGGGMALLVLGCHWSLADADFSSP